MSRWYVTDSSGVWADGALFELQKGHEKDSGEFTTGLPLLKKIFCRNSLNIKPVALKIEQIQLKHCKWI